MPEKTYYPADSPLSTPAVEDYCLLRYSDRYKYKRSLGVEEELITRFKNSKPSDIEIKVFSESFKRNFTNSSEIRFSEDELYGYAYRENGHKKLISVFYISHFKNSNFKLD